MSHRVVIITEIIAPYRIPVFNALARLPEIDLHVIFLAETDSAQWKWRVYKEEIQFSYEVLRSWRGRVAGNTFLFNWGVSAALKRFLPDSIVFGGYNYLASWKGLLWARSHGVPALLWAESNVNDRRSRNPIVEFLKSTFIRACRAFVVPGRSSHNYLSGYGVAVSDIFTAPNAVDNNLFAAGAEAARKDERRFRDCLNLPDRYLLFVGRFVREKGIFDLLDGYALLPAEKQDEVGIVFVGDGPERAELARRVANLCKGEIRIVGFAQRDQLAIYYGLADVFIFPTHSDPWGLVVNEAMACGLPILATAVAGCVADLVSHGDNGLVVTARDVSGMAKAIAAMLDMGRLQQMGASSQSRIKAFSSLAWAEGVRAAVEFATGKEA